MLFDASGLHLAESRNSNLGFALAFSFSSTSSTISGRETFGDNQETRFRFRMRPQLLRRPGHRPRIDDHFRLRIC